jgi:hypothetical protein
MPNRRPQLELIAPSASPQEAAAVVAALERFMRDTAPPPALAVEWRDPWARVATLEGVGREEEWPTAWGDRSGIGQHPWV